ncbi:GNAT family N-acetyltransferase [Kordiimonas sp.]|uniref:GNAT family N-acetyltransferase n=1 Tax=Kordiimonas sp. TaxID=1970157 RepID=UPI003A8CC3E9
MAHVFVETERLKLREWCHEDRAAFAAMNADADVMRYFPHVQSREESDASVDRCIWRIQQDGFGFWATEFKKNSQFIGFIGIQRAAEYLPFAPAIEIGWRLDKSFWGEGLAPEGAKACLAFAFDDLDVKEVIAMTTKHNAPSRRVMDKIAMTYDPHGDFDHPMVPEASPIRPHVLYRVRPS